MEILTSRFRGFVHIDCIHGHVGAGGAGPASAAAPGSLWRRRANLRARPPPTSRSVPIPSRERGRGLLQQNRPPAALHRPQSRHAVGKYSNKQTQGAGKRSQTSVRQRRRGGGLGGKRWGKKLGIGCTRTSTHLPAGAEENISHTPWQAMTLHHHHHYHHRRRRRRNTAGRLESNVEKPTNAGAGEKIIAGGSLFIVWDLIRGKQESGSNTFNSCKPFGLTPESRA